MIIIGEKINTVRKTILLAYQEKDTEHIRKEAILQAEAGADVIDINAGTSLDIEPSNMAWAVKIVQEAVDIPVCIDSPNPRTIKAGFDACQNKKAAWLNSITLEKDRYDVILSLSKEHKSPVIALCMDENGVPRTVEDRILVAKRLADVVDSYGISLENLYLDPLIEPVSIHTDGGLLSLSVLKKIKLELSEAKTVICLSAISFGLPKRKLINRVYLPLLMYEGIDAVILDPLDSKLMSNINIAELLLNRDKDCLEYLAYYRQGNWEE